MSIAGRSGSAAHAETSAGWEYALLRYAALVYAFGLIVHTAGHFRRGLDVLTPQVFWAGNVSTVVGVAVIVLVLAGHRIAPYVAVAFGLPTALGVIAVHLLPHWSALSDAFPGANHTGVTSMSWGVVLVEIVGGIALSAAGVLVLRRSSETLRSRDEAALE